MRPAMASRNCSVPSNRGCSRVPPSVAEPVAAPPDRPLGRSSRPTSASGTRSRSRRPASAPESPMAPRSANRPVSVCTSTSESSVPVCRPTMRATAGAASRKPRGFAEPLSTRIVSVSMSSCVVSASRVTPPVSATRASAGVRISIANRSASP